MNNSAWEINNTLKEWDNVEKEDYSKFKQYIEGERISQTKNTTWELINTHMDWDKQEM